MASQPSFPENPVPSPVDPIPPTPTDPIPPSPSDPVVTPQPGTQPFIEGP